MKMILLSCVVLSLATSGRLAAQQPEFPSAQAEHQWLKQFAGQWKSLSKTVPYGDTPAMECTGTMKSNMLGEFWIVNRVKGDMNGVTVDAIQTIGYDAKKEKYIGSWVDSMTSHHWLYEGDVDASGKKLSLMAEGPNYVEPGKVGQFRDSYEFKSPDLIIVSSEMQGPDGNWVAFMTGEMRRVK